MHFQINKRPTSVTRRNQKSINGDKHILWAMTILQIEVYAETLQIYINKYKEVEGEKLSINTDQLGNGHKKKIRLFILV
jgi:hypothetical protein